MDPEYLPKLDQSTTHFDTYKLPLLTDEEETESIENIKAPNSCSVRRQIKTSLGRARYSRRPKLNTISEGVKERRMKPIKRYNIEQDYELGEKIGQGTYGYLLKAVPLS